MKNRNRLPARRSVVENLEGRALFSTGTITGTVFLDRNGDGAINSNEGAFSASWTLYIDSNLNSKQDSGEPTAVSNASGIYVFNNVNAGAYRVNIVARSGYAATIPTSGRATVNVAGGATTTQNFGERFLIIGGLIRGYVYNDANGNGVKDTGELPMSGVTVYSDANNNGSFDSGDTASNVTDSNGLYYLENMAADTYRLREIVPSGYTRTAPSVGYIDVTMNSNEQIDNKNFFNKQNTVATPGNITGTFYNDVNGNYKLDTGEGVLASWTAYIDANKNGKLDTGEKTALTNSSGKFTFSGITAGAYQVRPVIKSGYRMTAPSAGYYNVNVASGATVSSINFLATTRARINGYIYNDANSSGAKDTGEAGLYGWRIYIDTNKNGKLDTGEVSVLTTSTGFYAFEGLVAGTYTLRVAQPTGWKATVPTNGVGTIGLAAAQTRSNVMFGEKKIA